MIDRLDHLNIRTANLDAMVAWYGEVLRMEPGPRPDFGFPGAWLYAAGQPMVHLVGVADAPTDAGASLRLEHGAFSAHGLAEFLDRLRRRGERFRVSRVPGFPIVQVNVWDPDGNHLHVDFDSAEAEGMELAG